MQQSPLQKSLQRLIGQGSYARMATHVGCGVVSLVKFAKGKDDALTEQEQLRLGQLIGDLDANCWEGKPRLTTFYEDESGETKWNSGLMKGGGTNDN